MTESYATNSYPSYVIRQRKLENVAINDVLPLKTARRDC